MTKCPTNLWLSSMSLLIIRCKIPWILTESWLWAKIKCLWREESHLHTACHKAITLLLSTLLSILLEGHNNTCNIHQGCTPLLLVILTRIICLQAYKLRILLKIKIDDIIKQWDPLLILLIRIIIHLKFIRWCNIKIRKWMGLFKVQFHNNKLI